MNVRLSYKSLVQLMASRVIPEFAAFGAIADLLVEFGLVMLDRQRLGQKRTNGGSTAQEGAPQALCI